jgi:hypothetical protein
MTYGENYKEWYSFLPTSRDPTACTQLNIEQATRDARRNAPVGVHVRCSLLAVDSNQNSNRSTIFLQIYINTFMNIGSGLLCLLHAHKQTNMYVHVEVSTYCTLLQIFVMNTPKMEHNAANPMHTVSLMLSDLIRIKLCSLNLIEYSAKNVLQYHRALVLKRTSCIETTI